MSGGSGMEGQLVDNMFWALWYNGLDDEVERLAGQLEGADGRFLRSDTTFDNESILLLWMMLVQQFGDYGTSPRQGWIDDAAGAARFLRERIARTWRQDD